MRSASTPVANAVGARGESIGNSNCAATASGKWRWKGSSPVFARRAGNSMTDTIADLLTRIRNAQASRHTSISMPSSKARRAIADKLSAEGWLGKVTVVEAQKNKPVLQIELKYDDHGNGIIQGIERISKPGRRLYAGWQEMPVVKGGMGTVVITSSRGVMTGREARKDRVGGELLCKIW